jgi:CRP-like cAMP-binding protein
MGRGTVIQTLRLSSVLAPLTEVELKELANCGRICSYETSQHIVTVNDRDDYMFVLHRGQVALHLIMLPNGGQCEGMTTVELSSPGEVFGWGAWLRPDGIMVAAYALEPCSVVRLNLDRLKEAEMSWKVSWRMLQNLYGLLQERGLCPPNVQALLKLGQVATLEWAPASKN